MLFVALALAVVAAALAVMVVRSRAEIEALTERVADERRARERAEAVARGAEAAAATAVKERDDALERAQRARRDAAEVAKRMQAEAEARAAAEDERRVTLEERDRLEEQLAAAEQAVASGGEDRVAELWSLALAGVQRTWEVSVCPSPGMPSPLEDTDDPFRTAVEIEVDAAREEAGAAIELEWRGDEAPPVGVAVRALSIVQELVARLAKVADEASLVVTSQHGEVAIEVRAFDVSGRDVVPDDVAPAYRAGPGRYVLGGVGDRPDLRSEAPESRS